MMSLIRLELLPRVCYSSINSILLLLLEDLVEEETEDDSSAAAAIDSLRILPSSNAILI